MEALLGQLSDFTYVIPFVDVTVNKTLILDYAKTHAENGGPLFALGLLLLFGIAMTLVWLYLMVCACCCRCRNKPGRSPRDSGTSRVSPTTPISPSRSTAPLRRKGSASSAPYQVEDDPDGGGLQLRRGRSLEPEHRQYSFKCLYVTSTIVSALLGLCVVAIFAYQSKFDASAKMFLDDVEGFMLDGADAMCTSQEGSSACNPKSIGKFVDMTEAETTDTLAELVAYLEAIDDNVYPYLNATINDLNAAKADLENIEVYANQINADIALIQQYKDWLVASSPATTPTPLSEGLPEGDLPTVTNAQLAAVDDGVAAVNTALTNADDAYRSIQKFMATDVAQAVAEFNTSDPAGTTTQQLLAPLDQVSEALGKARDTTIQYYQTTDEQGERYTGYLALKTWAVSIIFLLPLLFLVFLTLMNRTYTTCSGHLVVGMCCSYVCLLLFLLLGMVFSLLAALNGTVCEYHLAVLAKVPAQNVTVNDVELHITPAVLKSALRCPNTPGVTADNNFVSLLGAEQVFNVSSQVEEALAQIEEARTSFDAEAQISDAVQQLASLQNSTAFNITESGTDIAAYRGEVVTLLEDLPPVDMDRDNDTQRDGLTHYYITDPKFSWRLYDTNLTAVNALLDGATPIPPGFLPVYTFQTAWNFTSATVEAEPAWEDVVFKAPTTLDDLLDGLATTDPFTTAANKAVAVNAEVHTNLTAVVQAIDDIQRDVDAIGAVQGNIQTLQTQVNTTLYALLDQARGIMAGLVTQEDNIRDLSSFVTTAPEYTKCGWVGDFYHEGFQEGFCGDLHHSVSTMWPFMLAASVCLFVSFVTFSCFVRKPRWYLDPSYESMDDRNALTPGRTPRGAALALA